MSQIDYQPWRSDDDADDLLAADVSAQWRQLLGESKTCVARLRSFAAQADRRLELGARMLRSLNRDDAAESHSTHRRILRQLDDFERRLAAMERRMDETAPRSIPHPLGQTRNHAA